MVVSCGLLTANKERVPLKGIEVEVEVKDHVAVVVYTQHYENKEDKAIEAVFVFPLPGDAAVCHFSAKIGQTEIVAEVKEKQEAREEYDDALSSGQQAFLLEESDQSPDIFSLNVGSLPPGESASIRLEYVTELAVEADSGLRFCLPVVLNPRYQPQGSEGHGVKVTAVPASLVPYSLSFSARVSSPREVLKVDSKCSLEPLQYLNKEKTQAVVKLAAGHKFDRDIELFIYYKNAHQPAAVVEAGKAFATPGTIIGDPVMMLSVYPEFSQEVMSSITTSGEFVFLLDRSGSMDGARISSARDTLLLLLKSLPVGCYFNIYSFGSSFEPIFQNSIEYNETTLEKAQKKVEEMRADMGGTEILKPLNHIYSQPCIPGQPRQLFVFTDGEVGNTNAVISLVKKNSSSHRCFSFGIGEGASTALITGLAKEGRGYAQFITGADRMQPKVMQSLQFALQPAVKDISVNWDLPEGVSVTPLSPPLTAIFKGQRSLIYAQLTGQSAEGTDGHVTVTYTLAGHSFHDKLSFPLQPTEDTGLTVHRLGARTLIRCLETEKGEEVKKKVVEVSVQSGVSSSFTSFIAVNKTSREAIHGPLLQRRIPGVWSRSCYSLSQQAKASRMQSHGMARACSMQSHAMAPAAMLQGNTLGVKAKPESLSVMDKVKHLFRPESKCSDDPVPTPAILKHPDSLLQLVSLQKASGCWELNPALAAALNKTSKELEQPKPPKVNGNVWATVLALVWLHAFKLDAQIEWKLLAQKAVSWLTAQNAPSMTECIMAGNTLLGSNVQKDALGL
ncbi:von Willebrand factor A domain-containing protein 5A-like isoform X2 [Corythoichthys intestinalis]|uniref:von Willebrand factor A domain-containing protein 5A-like isoform X2 n=1 Tax=Corythoichthys intestinalis TaxID=161448 RepID=UPI0025A4F2EA|nr:von Willebrand factor A domain-containing protein 5A-like isoform X2 [Corythoichthys intestinalis]